MKPSDGPAPFTTLIDHEMKLYCAWENAPGEADVAALEARIGRLLPAEYRAFLMKYGGVMLEVRPDVWPRPQEGDGGSAWSFQYAFIVYGTGEGLPGWLSLETVVTEFRDENPESSDLLPFFRWITSEDRLCFGTDDKVYEWSPGDEKKPRLIDKPFDEIIYDVTAALVECKAKIREQNQD